MQRILIFEQKTNNKGKCLYITRVWAFLIRGERMKREVISVRKNVSPLEVSEVRERVKYNGNIERILIRFYAGQENELTVLPYVQHKGKKNETFFTFPEGTDPYLSGEDDRLDFPLSIEVEYDDEIVIRSENKSAVYDYTLVCDIIITYYEEPSAVTGGKY
jgi:hypothetical protein